MMVSLSTSDTAGATDKGRWRASNQDSWCINEALGLAAVADGMGGHTRGDEASHIALKVLADELERRWSVAQGDTAEHPNLSLPLEPMPDATTDADGQPTGSDDGTDTASAGKAQGTLHPDAAQIMLTAAIDAANLAVNSTNESNGFSPGTGMGTTLTGLWFVPGSDIALVFNIGDSRVYRLAASTLVPLTVDHTLYREWEDSGSVGAAPPRNIILRAVGLYPTVDTDINIIQPAGNDRFLMCSDGLTGMVNDRQIGRIIETCGAQSAQVLCQQLIDAANEAGGEDNITAVIINCAI